MFLKKQPGGTYLVPAGFRLPHTVHTVLRTLEARSFEQPLAGGLATNMTNSTEFNRMNWRINWRIRPQIWRIQPNSTELIGEFIGEIWRIQANSIELIGELIGEFGPGGARPLVPRRVSPATRTTGPNIKLNGNWMEIEIELKSD